MKQLYDADEFLKLEGTESERTQKFFLNYIHYLRIVAKYTLHIHRCSNKYDNSNLNQLFLTYGPRSHWKSCIDVHTSRMAYSLKHFSYTYIPLFSKYRHILV